MERFIGMEMLKNIAYAQIIFDKYFNLLNSLVWENTNDHKATN